jgi:large subunit ribosomal protein L15
MPLHRRLPKRGFTNIFRKEYAVVNLGQLAGLEAGTEVTPLVLKERGIVSQMKDGLKVLAGGQLKHPLRVHAHKFSQSAIEKIQKAGGTVEVITQ